MIWDGEYKRWWLEIVYESITKQETEDRQESGNDFPLFITPSVDRSRWEENGISQSMLLEFDVIV